MCGYDSLKKNIRVYHLLCLFLIPFYFLSHNFFLYREEVDFLSMIPYIIGWFIFPIITYSLVGVLFRNKQRTTWLISIFSLIFYFFFGPIYSVISSLPYILVLAKVSVILFFLISVIILIIVFRKRINLENSRLPKFINTLLILLIIFDLINYGLSDNILYGKSYDLKEKDPIPALQFPLTEKPDIYYIFFDELMQSDALREVLRFDNSTLDSALTKRGFFVASKSKSAYFATPYSIASAFQSSVFIGKKKKGIHLVDYLVAYKEIQQNAIVPYLIRQGYSIQNFAHYKLFREESEANFKDPSYDTRQIVLNQTFSSLMYQLILGVMTDKLFSFFHNSDEEKAKITIAQKMIHKKYNEIIQASLKKKEKPLFVHGHFFAPHLPVFFDSSGMPLSYEKVLFYKSHKQLIPAYKLNLAFSRKLIISLVDEIMKNTDNKAVIIIQSDHGFRGAKSKLIPIEYKFSNFTAIYFPDKEYQSLDKEFFLPNTFRYLLNKYSNDTIRLTSPEYIRLSSQFLDD